MQHSNYHYHPFYCEENIWHLSRQTHFQDGHAIFIAAKGEVFPMLKQRSSIDPDQPLLWDYHVIFMTAAPYRIMDFDTTLPFCSDACHYFRQSFPNVEQLLPEYTPYFRLVSARHFATQFRSDRSHMQSPDGWLAEPPAWPLIDSNGSNLQQFIDMKDQRIGEVLSYTEILNRIG